MKVFGKLPPDAEEVITNLRRETTSLLVPRRAKSRSSDPFPASNDLEISLKSAFEKYKFSHHVELKHPTGPLGFEYDFFHEGLGIAVEIMGYRADDEIYKDILKFHVHKETRVGVVWVPKRKLISGKETETNYRATLKALTFADTFLKVEALVAVPYDWEAVPGGLWKLIHTANGS